MPMGDVPYHNFNVICHRMGNYIKSIKYRNSKIVKIIIVTARKEKGSSNIDQIAIPS